MFNTLVSAGIKPRHVAKIMGISRVTASQWLNERTKPHPLLRNKVKLLIESVEKAVSDERLPAPEHYRGQQESDYICRTVLEYMDDAVVH